MQGLLSRASELSSVYDLPLVCVRKSAETYSVCKLRQTMCAFAPIDKNDGSTRSALLVAGKRTEQNNRDTMQQEHCTQRVRVPLRIPLVSPPNYSRAGGVAP